MFSTGTFSIFFSSRLQGVALIFTGFERHMANSPLPVLTLGASKPKASTLEHFKYYLDLLYVKYNYRQRTYVRREVMFSQVCVCSTLGGGTPSQVRRGYPVPGLGGGGTPGTFLLPTWQAVCLLRSRRRTFLFCSVIAEINLCLL